MMRGSVRLATWGIGVGVGAFIVLECCRDAPLVGNVLAGAMGVVAFGLGAAASRRRRSDGGTRVLPIIAGVLGLLLVLGAVSPLVLEHRLADTSAPWTYRAPDGTYGLVLPSERWREGVMPGRTPRVMFSCPYPAMRATVFMTAKDKTEADLTSAFTAARTRMEAKSGTRATPHEGTNAHGNAYRYVTFLDANASDPSKLVFVADCYTWNPKTQVLVEVLFEAPITMLSETGRQATAKVHMDSAKTICQGVE